MDDETIRLEALKVASQIASPTDDVANILIHADWLYGYVKTGAMPERSESAVTGSRTVLAA